MAREESDREDLMREATALVRRAELQWPGVEEPIFIGFRRTGAFAIYWGADPVYQFDAEHRLRRVYSDGFLYRTTGETLAKLDRVRTDSATELRRTDLPPGELTEIFDDVRSRCEQLLQALQSERASLIAAIPDEASVIPAAMEFIARVLADKIRLAPAIPGRK